MLLTGASVDGAEEYGVESGRVKRMFGRMGLEVSCLLTRLLHCEMQGGRGSCGARGRRGSCRTMLGRVSPLSSTHPNGSLTNVDVTMDLATHFRKR